VPACECRHTIALKALSLWFVAQKLGNNTEASFAHPQMINLLNATNSAVVLSGALDEFRIYSGALTAAQVQALFHNP
jgi:hypothetical protein